MNDKIVLLKKKWPSTCHQQWMTKDCVIGLVSVIIPSYNHALLIEDTLYSIFSQTYRPIEVLVIDDGSVDDTFNIVKRWEEKNSDDSEFHFSYIYQKNKGAPSARNLGLIRSHGEFIQFIDSDDILAPEKFKIAVDVMSKDKNISFVYSLREDMDGITKKRTSWKANLADLEHNLSPAEVAVNSVCTALPVFKREIIYYTGPWNEELSCHQDWEYFSRISFISNKAVHIPIAQAFCRQHDGERISNSKWGNIKNIISYDTASRFMYDLILYVPDSPQKKKAIKNLSRRCMSCARVAVAAGEVQTARKLILKNNKIFKTDWLCFLESVAWYWVSYVPGKACRAIFKPMARLKAICIWFLRKMKCNTHC